MVATTDASVEIVQAAGTEAGSYQKQAYDYVKSRILNLELRPGAIITDSQVAAELNVSRTPVREAFYRLEHEGLLVNQARRGWKVYTLSLQDIHQIFSIKEALEGMVAREAAGCGDERLRADLRKAVDSMLAAAQAANLTEYLKADKSLHSTLFAMAANDRAAKIVHNLNDQWHRVRVGFLAIESRMEKSAGEHQAMAEQVLLGNGERAEQLMRAHLNNVRAELVRLLVNVVMPFVQEGV